MIELLIPSQEKISNLVDRRLSAKEDDGEQSEQGLRSTGRNQPLRRPTAEFTALFAIVLIVGTGCTRSNSTGLSVVQPLQTFGKVDKDGTVFADFRIANHTSRPVKVTNITLSCGCAKLELANKVIPEGDEVTARLIANVANRYGLGVFNAVQETNDPDVPKLILQMSGTIRRQTLPSPIRFQLGRFPPGGAVDDVIKLAKSGMQDAQLSVQSSNGCPGIDSRVIPQPKSEVYLRLKVTGHVPTKLGLFTHRVAVKGTRYFWEHATLELVGEVVGRWEIPADLFVGIVPKGGSRKKTVAIRDRFPAAGPLPQTPTIRTDSEAVKAKWVQRGGAVLPGRDGRPRRRRAGRAVRLPDIFRSGANRARRSDSRAVQVSQQIVLISHAPSPCSGIRCASTRSEE